MKKLKRRDEISGLENTGTTKPQFHGHSDFSSAVEKTRLRRVAEGIARLEAPCPPDAPLNQDQDGVWV
jgi:hypothetical protein